MRIVNRVAAFAAGCTARIGCVALVLGLAFATMPVARASTLDPSLLPNVEAATFEVVAAKPAHHTVTYAKPLPTDLIPYQQRTDKYHSIGTAFAIGPNRYVTAGHVLRAGLNSLWGPLELRDSKGHVYAIGKILKFSLRKDFVVFTLKDPPQDTAVLPLDTHPALNSKVYAVGNALGTGIVIRGGLYTSKTPEAQSGAWDWLRFSAATSPGNSGGPLLNSKGQVLGVVLMMNRNGNLNYALPISEVLKAPKDKAVIDKRISYGFPLFQDRLDNAFKAQFKLPMSLAQFSATYLKLVHAYSDAQLKAILSQNAATLFPHGSGSARMLYGLPNAGTFPALFTRQASGDWVIALKKSPKFQLGDHGYLRLGSAGKHTRVLLFHLRMPDSVPAAKLYGHPVEIMRLILKSGFMTRHIKSSRTKFTSFGKPVLNTVHTDAWRRHWRVAVWPIPYANHLWMMYALPVPDGYVGFIAMPPASREHDWLTNLQAMTNFFYTAYEGTLGQWKEYLKYAKLPAAFQDIDLGIHYGKRFSYKSTRVRFAVTPKLQKIDADSKLTLGFSFFHGDDSGKVVWGVSAIQLDASQRGKDHVVVIRAPNPTGDPSESYHHQWDQALHRQPPFDAVASNDSGVMEITGVAGRSTSPKPAVLYTATYHVEGQHSQAYMKKRLTTLMQGLQVHEH